MTILIIILILILIILLAGTALMYNKLVTLRNMVKNSESSIQVYLQQRFDLIPNLIEVVKGYVKHEKEVFERIAELRAASKTDIHAANELNQTFTQLYAVAESNPDLKAGEQFLNLQNSLSKMESQLQAARRAYNMDVTKFNTAIEVFPMNIVANTFGFNPQELFKGDDEIKKNINVSF